MMQNLTPHEQKVFDLLMAGIPPKEIASRLNVVYDTVAAHQKKIYRKMEVNSLQELLVKYLPVVMGQAGQSGSAVQGSNKRNFPLLKVLIAAAAVLVGLGVFLFLKLT